jgi:hypothetical protein
MYVLHAIVGVSKRRLEKIIIIIIVIIIIY